MLIHRIKKELDTPFVPERVMTEIRCRLTDDTFDSESEFIGGVEESTFKIRKNPRYNMPAFVHVRNSWAPVFIGTVESHLEGSRVSLTVRPAIISCVFDLLFQAIGIIEALFAILLCVTGAVEQGVPLLIFSLIFVLAIELFVFLFFKIPAGKMLDRLEEILSGRAE